MALTAVFCRRVRGWQPVSAAVEIVETVLALDKSGRLHEGLHCLETGGPGETISQVLRFCRGRTRRWEISTPPVPTTQAKLKTEILNTEMWKSWGAGYGVPISVLVPSFRPVFVQAIKIPATEGLEEGFQKGSSPGLSPDSQKQPGALGNARVWPMSGWTFTINERYGSILIGCGRLINLLLSLQRRF